MIIVVSGPGGVGKGTVVHQLVRKDPRLWLSRSWTTRARRPGEGEDAYTFVDRATFEKHIAEDGFLEHAEFLGNRYGTPWPDLEDGRDIVLEIDVQGARQVAARQPDALLIFLTAPSREAQEARLRARGDGEAHVAERVREAEREVADGQQLGATFVVNDDLDRTVDELLAIIDAARRT